MTNRTHTAFASHRHRAEITVVTIMDDETGAGRDLLHVPDAEWIADTAGVLARAGYVLLGGGVRYAPRAWAFPLAVAA